MKATCISLLVGGFATATLAAGAAAPDADQLLACSRLQDTAARLQCFDRATAPLAQQAAPRAQPPATVPLPATPRAAPPATLPVAPPAQPASPQEFGQEQLKAKGESGASQEPPALNARIASLRKGGPGKYLVTLDNGQVWSHESSVHADYLIVGEAVTISRAALGSYRLTRDAGKAKNWIRVTRVR